MFDRNIVRSASLVLVLMTLAACSRQGVVERWELPIERVRVRPSDASLLITVAGREFYIEQRKNTCSPGVLLNVDARWDIGHIEYVNRTHDVGRPNEGTSEEYTIALERSVPPGTNLHDVPARVQLSSTTMLDGAGRFIDAKSLSDIGEFVDVKVSHWTTLKYLRIRQGHDYWK